MQTLWNGVVVFGVAFSRRYWRSYLSDVPSLSDSRSNDFLTAFNLIFREGERSAAPSLKSERPAHLDRVTKDIIVVLGSRLGKPISSNFPAGVYSSFIYWRRCATRFSLHPTPEPPAPINEAHPHRTHASSKISQTLCYGPREI